MKKYRLSADAWSPLKGGKTIDYGVGDLEYHYDRHKETLDQYLYEEEKHTPKDMDDFCEMFTIALERKNKKSGWQVTLDFWVVE